MVKYISVALTLVGFFRAFQLTHSRPDIECDEEPPDAKIPRNATRIFFIGAHHTGTTSYIYILRQTRLLPWPKHDFSWTYQKSFWWQYNAFADVPFRRTAEWATEHEFGSNRHPDLRMLYRCFPNSLFVLNTRPLGDYVRSKLAWEQGRSKGGIPSDPCKLVPPNGTNNIAVSPQQKRRALLQQASGETQDGQNLRPMGLSRPIAGKRRGSRGGGAKNLAARTNSVTAALGGVSASLKARGHPDMSLLGVSQRDKICDMAIVRERIHAKYLDFILEKPDDGDKTAASGEPVKLLGALAPTEHPVSEHTDRRSRFLGMDVTTEGSDQVARRLCLFLQAHEMQLLSKQPGDAQENISTGVVRDCSSFPQHQRLKHASPASLYSSRTVHASKYASASCELEVIESVFQSPMLAQNKDFTTAAAKLHGGANAKELTRHFEGSCPRMPLLQDEGRSAIRNASVPHSADEVSSMRRSLVLAFPESHTRARMELIEELFSRFS